MYIKWTANNDSYSVQRTVNQNITSLRWSNQREQ
jgi:hypothetical protein